MHGFDEYAYRIPHPDPKVKVPSTQDKHHVSWAALQSYTATATALYKPLPLLAYQSMLPHTHLRLPSAL